AEQLTSVPGASNYFIGSVVCYATETKIKVLGVPKELVEKHSVVSEEVAIAMAERVKNLLGTDFAIATTGNAGPTKGDSDADIGTVYIAISSPKGTFAQKFSMGNHRERVVKKSVGKAFELLYKEILNF
ncbi:MAG: damage-inducible protein CinA, partial [Flavobacteriia bacterium]